MRAAKLCSDPLCTNVVPCPVHSRKPFAGTARDRGQRISGSRRQKRARYVLDRDSTVCHWCGRPGADEADHIIPLAHGGADTVENMAAIHREPCHSEKSSAERAASKGGYWYRDTPVSVYAAPKKAGPRARRQTGSPQDRPGRAR